MLLNKAEVKELLNIKERAFFYLLKRGELTRVWQEGKMYFHEHEVVVLAQKRKSQQK